MSGCRGGVRRSGSCDASIYRSIGCTGGVLPMAMMHLFAGGYWHSRPRRGRLHASCFLPLPGIGAARPGRKGGM